MPVKPSILLEEQLSTLGNLMLSFRQEHDIDSLEWELLDDLLTRIEELQLFKPLYKG